MTHSEEKTRPGEVIEQQNQFSPQIRKSQEQQRGWQPASLSL